MVASGTNLTYQWLQGSAALTDNTVFSGSQSNGLTITGVSAAQLGSYSVAITGTCGTNPLNSTAASLSQTTTPITIITQPVGQTLAVGGSISLSIAATGPTLSYQWLKNGVSLVNDSRISGATSSSLQISNAQTTDTDSYSCSITSPCATQVTSSSASVVVSVPTSIQTAQALGFKVSPNPSSGMFVLSNDFCPFLVEQIEIISMQGTSILRREISGGIQINELVNIDISSGMYLLLIKGQGQQALVKIAVEK